MCKNTANILYKETQDQRTIDLPSDYFQKIMKIARCNFTEPKNMSSNCLFYTGEQFKTQRYLADYHRQRKAAMMILLE